MGGHFLLQGIFPTQESNPGLLPYSQILYQLSHLRNSEIVPYLIVVLFKKVQTLGHPGTSTRMLKEIGSKERKGKGREGKGREKEYTEASWQRPGAQLVGVQIGTFASESWQYPPKLSNCTPRNTRNRNAMQRFIHQKTCIQMLTAALLLITISCKHSTSSSIVEQIIYLLLGIFIS